MFGGLVRRQDGDPGTALNYFLFGLNGVNSMRDNRRQDEALRLAQQERELEGKHRDQVEQAIATLPPDQQVWARLNPDVFVRALAEAGNAEQWSEPFAFEHGMAQRNSRTGQVRVLTRPPAPLLGYMMPPDSNDWDYSE